MTVVIFAAAALALIGKRAIHALAAYLALAISSVWLALQGSSHDASWALPLTISAVLKLVVAPAVIIALLRSNRHARELLPAVRLPGRAVLALALLALASKASALPALSGAAAAPAIFTVLCGMTMLIVDRALLANVIGLLVVDVGATLLGAAVAPGALASLELGAAFDGLVVVVIAVLIARTLHLRHPAADVESLTRLRG